MSLSLGVFWVPKHLSNDHIDNRCVDQIDLFDLLGTKVSVQRLLHGQLLFKKRFLAGIIRLLVLLPALRMLIFVVLLVVISVKGRVKVLDVGCAQSLRSNLFFATKVDTEQVLRIVWSTTYYWINR